MSQGDAAYWRRRYNELETTCEQTEAELQDALDNVTAATKKLHAQLQGANQQIVGLKEELSMVVKPVTPSSASLKKVARSLQKNKSSIMSGSPTLSAANMYTDADLENVKSAAMKVIEERDRQIEELDKLVATLTETDSKNKSLVQGLERQVDDLTNKYRDLYDEYASTRKEIISPKAAAATHAEFAIPTFVNKLQDELLQEKFQLKEKLAQQELLNKQLMEQYRNYIMDSQKALQPSYLKWLDNVREVLTGNRKKTQRAGYKRKRYNSTRRH